jgi:hypothetical protein
VVGPPPVFMPGKSEPRPQGSGPGSKTIDAEVVSVDGKKPEPSAKSAEPSKIDEIKDKAKETLNTGKTLYKVAKATGKGGGWFAKQGFRLVGAMFKSDDKYEKKPEEEEK